MATSLFGDPAPAPQPLPASPRDKNDRKLVIIVISAVIVLFVGSVAGAAGLWVHYAAKFNKIDKTHEVPSSDTSRAGDLSTIYTNPAYGVTLKLPGQWRRARAPFRSFCTLAGSPDGGLTRLYAMFWPIFTGAPASVDTESNMIAAGYRRNAGWTLLGSESIQINGRDARMLRFSIPQGNAELALIVVNKWPATYALAVTGPSNAPDAWQRLRAALPQSIEIK
jgi:hypothetical protein